jgi:hypothetical protein
MKHNILITLCFLSLFKFSNSYTQEIHGIKGETAQPIKASFSQVEQRNNSFSLIENQPDKQGFLAPNFRSESANVQLMVDYGPIIPVDSSLLLPPIDTVLTFTGQLSDNAIIPSDPKGAVSTNYIITATSERIVFHNSSGAVLSSVTDESFWVNQDATGSRLSVVETTPFFDKESGRFFLFAQNGQNLQLSNILIAVSENENPLGNWFFYKIKTNSSDLTKSTHNINLGYNKDWFLVSTRVGEVMNDERANNNADYLGNRIFAFSRATLRDNLAIVPMIYNFQTSVLIPSQVDDVNRNSISLLSISDAQKAQYSLYEFGGVNPTIKHITEISLGDKNKWFDKSANDNTLPQKNMSSKVNGIYGAGGLGLNIVERGKNLWAVHPVYFSSDGSNTSASTLYSGIQWIKIDTKEQWISDWGRLIDTSLVTYNGFKVSKNSYEYPSISVNSLGDVTISL